MEEQSTQRERERYLRQMMLNGFTVDHQKRLKSSTALIAGIGGLGGTAALYLAVAAGRAEGGICMMIAGVLAFSIAVFIVSYMISKAGVIDTGKLAVSITLVAWGSMIVGLCISRFSH